MNKSSHIIYEKNKYKDDKIDLFYDYSNSNDLGNLKNENNNKYYYSDNKFYSPIQNNYNNYSINNNYFNSFTENNNDKIKDKDTDIDNVKNKDKDKEDIYKDLNLSFKSNTLKEYIQTKKDSFDKLSSSINNIINKYNDEEDNSNTICKNENKKEKLKGINTINDNNLNKIVEHLIKAYSKDELKLIKDKLNNEVDDEEEPQPEKLNFVQHIYKRNKLKLSSDSPSFLKSNNNKNAKINLGNKNSHDKNKNNNKYFKKINKCIIYKPIKINNTNASNSKNFKKNENIDKYFSFENNKNNKSNNIKTKPEFYTYIQCKTSFDCLDSFLKRQKQFRSYTENKKNDLRINNNYIENKKHTFNPNTSYTSNSRYSIKLQAQRLNESQASKINRIISNSAGKNSKNHQLKYSKTFTFTPNINKNNKIYKKLTSDNKIKNKFKIETNKELTPVKYVNHHFDYVKSIYKNDGGLFKRIKEQNKKKIEKVEKLKIESENKEMEGCTFKPDMSISKTRKKNYSASKYFRNNSNKNAIHDEDKKNKAFSYIDFYEYKKKHKSSSKKK